MTCPHSAVSSLGQFLIQARGRGDTASAGLSSSQVTQAWGQLGGTSLPAGWCLSNTCFVESRGQ